MTKSTATTVRFAKIKPSETFIDYRYQRELDQRRVKAMTEAYDPHRVGVPVVSKRTDGTSAVADGQHRLAAATAAGHADVPLLMEIHEGLTLAQEAGLFLQLNGGRTAVGAIDKYKARLEHQEPVAMEIRDILHRQKCKIVRGRQRYGVSAVEAVEYAYHKGNLEKVMCVLVKWLDGDPEAFDNLLIRSVSMFLAQLPDASPLYLAEKLDSYAPSKVKAKLNREAQQVSNSRWDASRYVLIEIYNYRTAKPKRVSYSPPSVDRPKESRVQGDLFSKSVKK